MLLPSASLRQRNWFPEFGKKFFDNDSAITVRPSVALCFGSSTSCLLFYLAISPARLVQLPEFLKIVSGKDWLFKAVI
jgi:hypothetical protein